MKSKGLGDSIEKVTKKTGIKKATKWIFDKLGKDCGCDARKAKLNSMFPYKDPECLTEDEYIILKGFFSIVKGSIQPSEQKQLLTIHNRVFKTNREQSTCGSCVKGLVDTMKRLYDEYEYERENKKG
jgi:hypothetical protein|tara:strand:+ start:1855 stop:2235 length:381 start_codon:yes stop_codon:yes gene_type:complete